MRAICGALIVLRCGFVKSQAREAAMSKGWIGHARGSHVNWFTK